MRLSQIAVARRLPNALLALAWGFDARIIVALARDVLWAVGIRSAPAWLYYERKTVPPEGGGAFGSFGGDLSKPNAYGLVFQPMKKTDEGKE